VWAIKQLSNVMSSALDSRSITAEYMSDRGGSRNLYSNPHASWPVGTTTEARWCLYCYKIASLGLGVKLLRPSKPILPDSSKQTV
jgi:hypothetical protein